MRRIVALGAFAFLAFLCAGSAISGYGLGGGSVRARSCGPTSCSLFIIAKGDSRTQGTGMTAQQIYAYVGASSSAFTTAAPSFVIGTDYVNLGISGETIYAVSLDANNTGGPSGQGFDLTAMLHYINLQTTKMPVITWLEATNDLSGYMGNGSIGGPGPPPPDNGTAAGAVRYLASSILYLRTHATRSFRVLCFTEEDRSASFNTGSQTTYETQMDLYATAVKNLGSYYCDGVFDLHADPNYGAHNAAANTSFFQDGVHNTIPSMAAIGALWPPYVIAIGGGS